MPWVEIVGLFGAFLTAITFIPQVYKAWQSKSVGDLSLTTVIIVFTSTVVWLVYGVTLVLWPVIIANACIGSMSLLLIYFKLTFKS
jgi:MtN3 and saliva related transmembrane protein